jgi:hypothetical protein
MPQSVKVCSWIAEQPYRATYSRRTRTTSVQSVQLGPTAAPVERPPYQRISWVNWMRLPQVSFSLAILDPVTSVGGMVNSAPRAFMRS